MNVIECVGLGKRYRRTWALRDGTLVIPAGHVTALVGPNGAGKTTLLNLAVGLATPTTGTVTVLDGVPAGSPDALDRIAFVAQDAPLYAGLPVTDMLHVARNLNRRWDQQRAQARLVFPRVLGQRHPLAGEQAAAPGVRLAGPDLRGLDAGRLCARSVLRGAHPAHRPGDGRDPASRFWPFQFIEAGWLVVLSAIAIAAAIWLVRRTAA
jgi:ABC-type lipopolysaccharide export system ATPase subunit